MDQQIAYVRASLEHLDAYLRSPEGLALDTDTYWELSCDEARLTEWLRELEAERDTTPNLDDALPFNDYWQ